MVRYQTGPFANYLPFTTMTEDLLAKLAASRPAVIAAMHGSAFKGDGHRAIGELAKVFRAVIAPTD